MGLDAGGAEGTGFRIGAEVGLGGGGDAGIAGRTEAMAYGAVWDMPGGGGGGGAEGRWLAPPNPGGAGGGAADGLNPPGSDGAEGIPGAGALGRGASGGIIGAPAAGSGARRPMMASSATCLSKMAVFSSSSSQSISIEFVEPLVLDVVMGTVGVRPSEGGAGGFPGNDGTGMLGTAADGGMGAGIAWARLPMDGGGGATAPNEGVCGTGGADGGSGGGAAGIEATGGGGGGPPENNGGGGGGGAPPNEGTACEFPPGDAWGGAAILPGTPDGKGGAAC